MEEGRDGDAGERISATRARSPARRLSCHGSGLQPAKAQRRSLDGESVWGHVSHTPSSLFNVQDIKSLLAMNHPVFPTRRVSSQALSDSSHLHRSRAHPRFPPRPLSSPPPASMSPSTALHPTSQARASPTLSALSSVPLCFCVTLSVRRSRRG